jgi:hypothetical protein
VTDPERRGRWRRAILVALATVAVASALTRWNGGLHAHRQVRAAPAYFRTIRIDFPLLTTTFADPLTQEEAQDTLLYWPFHYQTGYAVDHYAGLREPRVRYDSFGLDEDRRLTSRTKHQELLHGEFGTIYTESTYFYVTGFRGPNPRRFTAAYANGHEHERPAIVPAPPGDELTLEAVSVVRVFRAPPEFLIVSANYDAGGRMQSVHVNGARNGNWIHPNGIPEPYRNPGVATMLDARPRLLGFYGLPPRFPVEAYRHAPSPDVFGPAEPPVELDVVNLHFDQTRFVEQQIFHAHGASERRFLEFRVTDADRLLAPLDRREPGR